ARREAIRAIMDTVTHYQLGGVTIDFESIPKSMHPLLLQFLSELKPALEQDHLLLTQAVPGDDPAFPRLIHTWSHSRKRAGISHPVIS
ncbi:MAG: hypothetical protein ABI621_13870, partial [Chloroflexota bacterium]